MYRNKIKLMLGAALGIAVLLLAPAPARAAFTSINKALIGGTTTVEAGSTVGYTITVVTGACPMNDIEVDDWLPTDGSGNPETKLVGSDCQSTAAGATSPACVGGAGALDPTGQVLKFTFPENNCGGTLTMHVYLKINSNLPDQTPITNCVAAEDAEGDVTSKPCAPAVTVSSSKLGIYPTAVCNNAAGTAIGLCDTLADVTSCESNVLNWCADPTNVALNASCVGGTFAGICFPLANAQNCLNGGGRCVGAANYKTATNAAGKNIANNGTTVPSDGALTYSFVVVNTGSLDANGLIVQDALPAGATLLPASATPSGFPDDCTVCGSLSSGVLSWQYGVLHPTQARLFSYAVTPGSLPAGAILFNVATAFDSTGHIALGTHTATENSPCLTLQKTVTDCTHVASCGGGNVCSGITGNCSVATTQACGHTADCPAANVCNNTLTDYPLAAPGPGDKIEYTLTVANGPSASGCTTANSVVVTDALVNGESYVSGTVSGAGGSCYVNGSTVTCVGGDLGSMAVSGKATVTLTVQVNSTTANGTLLNNVASAVAANGGGAATASRSVTVKSPQLQVVKAGSPSPVEPGGTLNYILMVSNAGGNCASQVSVTDTLPANAAYIDNLTSPAVDGLTFTGCGSPAPTTSNVFFNDQDNKFLVQGIDVVPGAMCTIQYQMLVPEGTQIGANVNNTVTAVDKYGITSQTATSTTPINTRLLGLSKTITGCTAPNGTACSVTNPAAGSTLQYTLQVASGPYMATGVIVTDSLPPVGPAGVGSFVSTTCPSSSLVGGVLTCNLGSIAPNASANFLVNFHLNSTNAAGTVVTNKASVTDDAMDQLGASNTVTDAVSVPVADPPPPAPTPSLQVSVVASKPSIRPGQALAYRIGVQNTGNAAAHNATVTDTLPASLRVAGASGGCKVNKAANSVTCTLGTLKAGKKPVVKTIVAVAAQAGQVVLTANASCDEGSTASGTASTTVVAAAKRK